MKLFSSKLRVISLRKAVLFVVLLAAFGSLNCSIPNLEEPECLQSRDSLRRFYSFHFANDMAPTADNLKLREKYLTPNFFKKLMVSVTGVPADTIDYFTASTDPPKTFKIGVCKIVDPSTVDMQVQVYWRDDNATVQKEVEVETLKVGDGWLINSVTPKP